MLLIRGKALIKRNWMNVNILVSDCGKIIKIYRSEKANKYFLSKVDKIFIANDNLILPGIIDIHVHMREPGKEHKETFETGTKAALASGVTVIGDMPNNEPPIDRLELFERKMEIANKTSFVDFFLYFMLSSSESIKKLLSKYTAHIKIYLYNKHQYKELMKNWNKYPKEPIYIFHAEHPQFIREESADNALELNRYRPPKAEVEGVKLAINFAQQGYKVHITHLTTPHAIDLIEKAKKLGANISYDVTPHHLIFYLEKINVNSPYAKVYPPIRPRRIRDGLIEHLWKGRIPILITDHAPHAPFEKKNFREAPPGIISIQYFLPLLYSLSKKLHIEFKDILKRVTENPAYRFKIPFSGKIKVGNWASLVIFDHKRKWIIDPEYSLSKAKFSIYDGMVVMGFVNSVFLRGHLAYYRGEFVRRIGKFVYSLY